MSTTISWRACEALRSETPPIRLSNLLHRRCSNHCVATVVGSTVQTVCHFGITSSSSTVIETWDFWSVLEGPDWFGPGFGRCRSCWGFKLADFLYFSMFTKFRIHCFRHNMKLTAFCKLFFGTSINSLLNEICVSKTWWLKKIFPLFLNYYFDIWGNDFNENVNASGVV